MQRRTVGEKAAEPDEEKIPRFQFAVAPFVWYLLLDAGDPKRLVNISVLFLDRNQHR